MGKKEGGIFGINAKVKADGSDAVIRITKPFEIEPGKLTQRPVKIIKDGPAKIIIENFLKKDSLKIITGMQVVPSVQLDIDDFYIASLDRDASNTKTFILCETNGGGFSDKHNYEPRIGKCLACQTGSRAVEMADILGLSWGYMPWIDGEQIETH